MLFVGLRCYCWLTTRITNEPGFIFPRRSPGSGGANSAAGRKMLWVLRSRPMVRALFFVGTMPTGVNLLGESSRTTLRTPSPVDANARLISGSKPLASTPSPIAGVAITRPVSASTIAIILFPQPANRRRPLRSIASPDGSSHGASFQRFVTASFRASN